jgi:hypothetical protein
MHCPASFRPIFSILMVSKVIPGSDGNLGNKVPGNKETTIKVSSTNHFRVNILTNRKDRDLLLTQ